MKLLNSKLWAPIFSDTKQLIQMKKEIVKYSQMYNFS